MALPEKVEFKVQRVDNAALDRLAPLMQACFGEAVHPRYFKWKYLDNPAGELVAFEASHEGKLCGFYGVVPEAYTFAGKPVTVYQAMDLMTHPDYQRRGLFSLLGSRTYETIAKEQGRIAVIGVPNYHILPGHVGKLGSKHIHSFPYIFAHRPYFRLRSLVARGPRVELVPVSPTASELEPYFKTRAPSRKAIAPVYSAAFLKWRLLDHPKFKYDVCSIREAGKIIGVCATLNESGGRVRIMLLDFAAEALYREHSSGVLARLFERTGASVLYSWLPTNEAIAGGLRSAGMLVNPFSKGPFSFRFPFITYSTEREVAGVDWTDIKGFDLQPIIQD